jgi:hypothetical protein
MYYFNDADNIVNWRTLKDGSWHFDRTRKPIAVFKPHPVDPFIRWSQLLAVFRLSISEARRGEIGPRPRRSLAPTFNRKGLDIWKMNLKLIREACKTIGTKLFVLKQATLITPGLPQSERRKCNYHLHGFNHNAHVAAFQGIYQVIEDEIPSGAIIDATVLSGRPEYFFDHIHLNPAGTDALAGHVSKALMNTVWAGKKLRSAGSDGTGRRF